MKVQMKKISNIIVILPIALFISGCGDKLEDYETPLVDFEKARRDFMLEQEHFVFGTEFSIKYDSLYSLGYVKEDPAGIRQATVSQNRMPLQSLGYWTVNCKKQQHFYKPFLMAEGMGPTTSEKYSQGYILSANICLLPATYVSQKLDDGINWE